MNRITQEAKKRQGVVKLANRKGKSFASRVYGVSLSSVKRWCKRYDGSWQSLAERSHRPLSHPKRHSAAEEEIIRAAYRERFYRYGWDQDICGKLSSTGTDGFERDDICGQAHGDLWPTVKEK